MSKVSALNIECSYRKPMRTPNAQDVETQTHKERQMSFTIIHPIVFFNRICLVFNALKVLKQLRH